MSELTHNLEMEPLLRRQLPVSIFVNIARPHLRNVSSTPSPVNALVSKNVISSCEESEKINRLICCFLMLGSWQPHVHCGSQSLPFSCANRLASRYETSLSSRSSLFPTNINAISAPASFLASAIHLAMLVNVFRLCGQDKKKRKK